MGEGDHTEAERRKGWGRVRGDEKDVKDDRVEKRLSNKKLVTRRCVSRRTFKSADVCI